MQGQSIIDSLASRVSCGQLEAPGPTGEQLDALFRVATRAADHRLLRPWRFLVIENEGLDKLGQLLVDAKSRGGTLPLEEKEERKLLAKPHRAPLIIVAVAHVVEDPKVPAVEQVLSTGAAAQNLINAAYAMGLGAMWRTGDPAYDPAVARGLGLADNEQIVGFIYLGTPRTDFRDPPDIDLSKLVRHWP